MKLLAPAAGAISLLGLAAALRSLLSPGLPPPPADVPSLVILPFANDSGDVSLEPWRTAFPDLIIADLHQSRFIDVIGTGKVIRNFRSRGWTDDRTLSQDDLVAIVGKVDVRYAATGSLSRSGEGIVADVNLKDPRRDDPGTTLRVTFKAEGGAFAAADELAKKIKAAVGLTAKYITRDVDDKVADVSTANAEAFLLYSQGYRSSPQAAIPYLQKAVDLDPDFGLAFKYLWMFHLNTGRKEEARRFALQTLALAERMSDPERLQFEALFYEDSDNESRDLRRVFRAYEELWRHYPGDDMAADVGGLGLAQLYMTWEEWGKAIPILEKYLSRRKVHWVAIGQLAECCASAGHFDKAVQVLTEYLNRDPEAPPVVLRRLGYVYLSAGRFADALACFDKLISASPGISPFHLDKAYALRAQGSVVEAEEELQRIVGGASGPLRINGLYDLSALCLAQGRIEEAKQRVSAGIELARQSGSGDREFHFLLAYLHRLSGQLPEARQEAEASCLDLIKDAGVRALRQLHLRALITLELGRTAEFESQVDEIRRLVEREQIPRMMRVYHDLLGRRRLQENDVTGAVDRFHKALDLLSPLGANGADGDHAKYYYSLVLAMEKDGRARAAAEAVETILLPTVSKDDSGDMYARALYLMGTFCDAGSSGSAFLTPSRTADNKAKAIRFLGRYLTLRANADPSFAPEVEDARVRLARLRAD